MKPAVKFGLINGGLGILWAMLMYVTELNRSDSASWINFLSLVIPCICMSLAIEEWRVTSGGGWVSFGSGFKQAFQVGLIATLIGIAFHYLYITVIDPAFIEFQLQQQAQKLAESGMSDEQIAKQMKISAPFFTPLMQVIFGFVVILIMNTVIALIIAAIKKRPNPEVIS